MHETQSRPADSWKFTPANSTVVVVDMQNIWVLPRGARYLPSSEDIVPKIQELLRYCHDRKIPVVYLHTTKRKDLAAVGIFADIKAQTHDADNEWSNFEGTPGAEIYEPLRPTQDDIMVKKFCYSGFYGTQLENLLRALAAIPSRSPASPPRMLRQHGARRGHARRQNGVFVGLQRIFFAGRAGCDPKKFRKALWSGYGLAHILSSVSRND